MRGDKGKVIGREEPDNIQYLQGPGQIDRTLVVVVEDVVAFMMAQNKV